MILGMAPGISPVSQSVEPKLGKTLANFNKKMSQTHYFEQAWHEMERK